MDDLTEHIDLYLSNSLSAKEMEEFKAKMKQDEGLAKAVRLQQKTTELLEAHAWLDTKEKVALLNKKSSSSVFLFLKLAAVFIGVIVGSYLLLNFQHSDAQLYSAYFSPYPDRITTMGVSETDKIEAITYYNNAEYAEAAQIFHSIRKGGKGNDQLLLYEAISLTELGETNKALVLLDTETIQANLIEAFAWQHILSLLANEEGEKAYEKLQSYLEMDYQYQRGKAKQLKVDLESIWR